MMVSVHVSQLEKMAFLNGNPSENPEFIDTRFGRIALQVDKKILFPRGLLGMPDKQGFFLTEFPSEKLSKFKLLQCTDDYGLSFIALPLEMRNGILAPEDIALACKDLGILPENLVILLIVSVHRSPQKISISVNARAPLLIDTSLKLAAQYVFQTDKYQVQHYITV